MAAILGCLSPMISEEQARAEILDGIQSLPSRKISLRDAMDCFAAEDYFARIPLPGFDNSAMDGYAVIAGDCYSQSRLSVIGEQPAGLDRGLRVQRGQAIRIFTGAPVPAGADAVVMQEDVERRGSDIIVNVDVEAGEFIRKRGCDLSEGQKILSKGERIHATTLALLGSQGLGELMVGGEVLSSILSTGDELASPGMQLQSGQIYDSNSILLTALLQRCGAILKSTGHCRDDRDSLRKSIERGIASHIFIVTGGVSVGEHDYVQEVLRELGARIDIWRVAIKPGKPFLFGRVGNCAVFGLPGNPVSAFVTFLQLVRPAILKMMGATNFDLPTLPATLGAEVINDGDRAHYFRGRIDDGTFTPIGRQESHALFGLSRANALLRIAAGEKIGRGATVNVQIVP